MQNTYTWASLIVSNPERYRFPVVAQFLHRFDEDFVLLFRPFQLRSGQLQVFHPSLSTLVVRPSRNSNCYMYPRVSKPSNGFSQNFVLQFSPSTPLQTGIERLLPPALTLCPCYTLRHPSRHWRTHIKCKQEERRWHIPSCQLSIPHDSTAVMSFWSTSSVHTWRGRLVPCLIQSIGMRFVCGSEVWTRQLMKM